MGQETNPSVAEEIVDSRSGTKMVFILLLFPLILIGLFVYLAAVFVDRGPMPEDSILQKYYSQ